MHGKCAIARKLNNDIGFGSTEFHVIRASQEIIPEWIFYYLRQEKIRQEAERNMTGSAGQKRVPTRFLAELKIPLPPLEEQKRIAKIAGKCDRIRRTRRYTQQLSDTYLQSVFLEMFGDPVTNPKGWDMKTLGDVSRKITDGEHLNPRFQDLGYPIVMAQQVDFHEVNIKSCSYVSFEDFLKFTKKM